MNKRRVGKALRRISLLPRNKYLFYYLANKLHHFYLKIIKSKKVAYPSTIMLELNNHCNLACTTCPREYDYGKAMDKGRMDMTRAKEIIDEMWPYLDSVGLTGMGETFIYKEIEEIVDYIKEKNKGIIISVSTNAVLPNFIELVKKVIGKIDTIQISIDGLNEVYDSIRINADFNELDENIKLMSKLCAGTTTDLMLNMVVTEENHHQMGELVTYADKSGVKYMDFSLFNLASVTDIDQSYYDLYKSEVFLKSVGVLNDSMKTVKSVEVLQRNFKTENSFQKCPLPWSHFYISWDGYIPPCCAKPFPKELNFGNVFSNKVIDMLNSESYQQFRTMWYANETPDFCKKCNFVNVEPVKEEKLPVIEKISNASEFKSVLHSKENEVQ